MAWEDSLIETVRIMIDDYSETPYTHSDNQIKKLLVLSAKLVEMHNSYDFGYTTDTVAVTITPDPADAGDLVFCDLICLRTACLIDHAITREMSVKPSVQIKEFQSSGSVNYKDAFNARLKILETGWCKTYQDALDSYLVGIEGDFTGGLAVMGPFRLYRGGFNGGY